MTKGERSMKTADLSCSEAISRKPGAGFKRFISSILRAAPGRRWNLLSTLRLPRTMIFLVLTQAVLPGASAQDKPKERLLAPLEAQRTVKSGRAETAEPGQTPDLARRITQLIVTAQAGQASAAFSEQQKRALVQLQERATSAVELKLNPLTGAVRQLKADILQPAEGNDTVTAQSFLRVNSKLLKIEQPDSELTLASSQTDELGKRHLRFDQQYRGLPVWPAQAVVHLDSRGNVERVNGAYVPTPADPGNATTPVIVRGQAIALAQSVVPDGANGELSAINLIFYATDEGIAKLGWKIELSASLHSDWVVVIDALNGDTLAAYDRVMHGGVSGVGVDLFNVSRALQVYQNGTTYYMVNTGKPMYDPTSTPPSSTKTRGGILIEDAKHAPAGSPPSGNTSLYYVASSSASSGWLADAVSAAYGLSEVYDYYLERFQRNSIDNKGGSILGVVRYGTGYNNAFWRDDAQAMFFGDGKPYARALDIVAHEMTHGITANSAKLEYVNQSGALNEAFSDIFGEAVEARTKGATDWLHGAELGSANRNLKDPHALTFNCGAQRPYPATMSEFIPATDAALSKCTNYDNGGVHINSSIINHGFYLLAAGLPGAIGLRDAERIFYRALTVHLAPKSQFIDARLAVIASAEELFGKASPQALKAAQAFDAIEIHDTSPTPPPTPIPVIAGADSTLFLFQDSEGWQLGRRETAFGDSAGGRYLLSNKPVAYERISVNGSGTFAAFVSADNDFCLINTDGTDLACLGMPDTFSSVALSPSARTAALVLLDSSGNPDNRITLIDISTGSSQTVVLKAGATDAGNIDTILYADVMAFDFGKSRLFYDAATQLAASDGSKSTVWSLYALDISSGATLSVVPPLAGVDVANPVLGHVRNDLLTFDAHDTVSKNSTIYVLNLTTSKLQAIGQTIRGYGFPSFTGDDSAIVYSRYDAAASSLSSLWRQALASDRMTPSGAPTMWLSDGDVATIYRRGSYASGTTVVEYFHSGLNNYFITADPVEQAMVDSGAMGAWKKTGYNFKAGGAVPVCRFYGNSYGPNSHFYTADEGECASLVAMANPVAKSWKLESYDFSTSIPSNGKCASGQVPVYRAYNNGFARGVDSNHRIIGNLAAYQQTVAAGWIGEGVIMCAPQ
jgi:Zn-dependent metalloprotease